MFILLVFVFAFAVSSEAILYSKRELGYRHIFLILRKSYWQVFGELFLDEISFSGENYYTCLDEISFSGEIYYRCLDEISYQVWVATYVWTGSRDQVRIIPGVCTGSLYWVRIAKKGVCNLSLSACSGCKLGSRIRSGRKIVGLQAFIQLFA